MRLSLILTSVWLLSGLLTCCLTQILAEQLNKQILEQDKQELAEIENQYQTVKQTFLTFGTRIKNFFRPKSDRPTPRPRDHIPAVIQDQEEISLLDKAAIVMAALSEDTRLSEEEEKKISAHRRLWKLISKVFR